VATIPPPHPEYEFDSSQSAVIRDLAGKMGGVGFVFILFGMLQIAYGVAVWLSTRTPDRLAEAAARAGVPLERVSPQAMMISAFAMALVGLVYFLVGLWTRQAATSFALVANTRGQDISRLMEAMASLNKMYALVYNLMLLGAVIILVSIGLNLYHAWQGR
jgi:hypothetical protein